MVVVNFEKTRDILAIINNVKIRKENIRDIMGKVSVIISWRNFLLMRNRAC